jgi:hypothetical protein
MRFRLGLVTGLATGYYLGARAGRRRYDQINRAVARVRRSDAFEVATERARSVVEEGVEKARAVIGDDAHHAAVGDDADRAAVGDDADRAAIGDDAHHAAIGDDADNSTTNGQGAGPDSPTAGIILPTDPPTGLGGYSSSR